MLILILTFLSTRKSFFDTTSLKRERRDEERQRWVYVPDLETGWSSNTFSSTASSVVTNKNSCDMWSHEATPTYFEDFRL